MKRFFALFLCVALCGLVACVEKDTEPVVPDNPVPENPIPDPDPDPEPEPEPLPTEADYEFRGNLRASIMVFETEDGLRNDYLSIYEEASDRSLYIDFYSPLDGEYLASGEYPLGDGSSMTCAQEYTYLTLFTNGELLRFSEGVARVEVDANHESGYPWYTIDAYFVMDSGESVLLDYDGQISLAQ